MIAPELQPGFEFLFPKQPSPAVHRIDYRSETHVVFVDDWGARFTWKAADLADSLSRGFAAPYEGKVPYEIRRRLQACAGRYAYTLSPKEMLAVDLPEGRVYVGVTTYSSRIVAVVNERGRRVRKAVRLAVQEVLQRQMIFATLVG